MHSPKPIHSTARCRAVSGTLVPRRTRPEAPSHLVGLPLAAPPWPALALDRPQRPTMTPPTLRALGPGVRPFILPRQTVTPGLIKVGRKGRKAQRSPATLCGLFVRCRPGSPPARQGARIAATVAGRAGTQSLAAANDGKLPS